MPDETHPSTFCSLSAAIAWGAALLRRADIETPRHEARLLLGDSLGLSREALLAADDGQFVPQSYAAGVARRAAREPLAMILGWQEFWSLRFHVSPATLIPRPDSEVMVAATLEWLAGIARPVVLDLGTGTGCLLLSVLHDRLDAWGVGIDIRSDATALAWRNARELRLENRAIFACASWGAALAGPPGGFDAILSNPPYIRAAEIAGLMPEVAAHEPLSALDGGPDGLAAYRALVPEIRRLLRPGGVALLEVGHDQAGEVAMLLDAPGWRIETRSDLAGHTRVVAAERPAGSL